MSNCSHQRISLGLDAAYCPDCKCEFRPWTAEYKQALGVESLRRSCPRCEQPLLNLDEGCGICGWMPQQFHQPVDKHTSIHADKQASIPPEFCALVTEVSGVNLDSSNLDSSDCQHDWAALWTSDLKLVDYCSLCHCQEPVSDRPTLEYHLSSVQAVLAEYEEALALSRKPSRMREFDIAMRERKQHLQYLKQRISLLGDKELEISPSTKANVLGDKPESESPSTDPEPDVLGDRFEEISPSPDPDVLGDSDDPISPSKKRRRKGDGSGSIHRKTITRGDKEYPQAWYHYEIWEKGDRLAKKTKYIPKRLVAKIQELEEKKAPVKEILKVLGGQQ